jgi:acyl carrier protein
MASQARAQSVSPLERTRSVVADVLRIPVADLDTDAPLAEVTTLDSLSLAEIASALDDSFGVRLPSTELAEVRSVRDLAELVERSPPR